MIDGFEEETAPLSEFEIKLLPMFVDGFRTKLGESNAVTCNYILTVMEPKVGKIGAPRVRKIVNHIRMHGLIKNLMASSKGYWVENDRAKLKSYANSLLARSEAIKAVANKILADMQQHEMQL